LRINCDMLYQMSNEECLRKQESVKALFAPLKSEEEKYVKIIDLGHKNPPLDARFKTPENIVTGCQSQMYLYSYMKDGKVYFEADSDALISAGLAALLIMVYSGESPETILTCPPQYIEDLGISTSLTPSRANGLYSVHLKMKQEALKFILKKD
jgi:cysteine desulfuration protein SufE